MFLLKISRFFPVFNFSDKAFFFKGLPCHAAGIPAANRV
ncbi:hypothetical protein DLM_2972 [Aquitalea magnusonii]|uniref:Uncharacterized protein n=1 Tax=Aquitalea magnusonii TaxID=332411 RepID=A0A3G9GI92_9NEIS|nr:hypothetical protein DLM_2972 [Aquitalea magnusonii]